MKQHFLYKYSFIILLLFIFACPLNSKSQEASSVSIIANAKGCPSDLNMVQLKSILMGEKQRWNDGTKVVIALMKTSTTIGNLTLSKIYKMSNNDLQRHFLALVFQGKGEAPIFFNSQSELQSFINQNPGSIGVLGSNQPLTEKIILVEGKKSI